MGTIEAAKGLPISGRESLNSDPTRNFRFLVSFQPYGDMWKDHPIYDTNFGFMSVSGLSMAVEPIPYREGGMNITLHQIPGQATFAPLTLSRGVHLGNSQAWYWMKKLFAAIGPGKGGSGYPAYQFRTSVTIHVLQHPLNWNNDSGLDRTREWDVQSSKNDPVAMSFRVYNAWISSLAYSDLNANDNAVMMEQITLAHEGFDMYWEESTKMGGLKDVRSEYWLDEEITPANRR